MLTEAAVPVRERILWIEGRASPQVVNALARATTKSPGFRRPGRDLYLVSFAYADLPIGKTFDAAFLEHDPENATVSTVKLVAITQQFSIEWTEVPHGWKTVCDLEFSKDPHHPLTHLPIVDGWQMSSSRCGLCTQETLRELLSD